MADRENSKNKSGKFLKKKKKSFPFLLILLLLAGLGTGIWWMMNNVELTPSETIPANTTEAIHITAPSDSIPAESEGAITEPSEQATHPSGDYQMPQAYLDVIDRYFRAVAEKWDFIQCEDSQICYMIILDHDISDLGYHVPDLNNDGIRELIISDGIVIYDLYTLQGDELVWVLSGGERNSYQLCQDGFIANHGANGAAGYADNFYYLGNGELVLKEGILFDIQEGIAQWSLTGEGIEEPRQINEKRYQEIVSSYHKIQIPLMPLTDAF